MWLVALSAAHAHPELRPCVDPAHLVRPGPLSPPAAAVPGSVAPVEDPLAPTPDPGGVPVAPLRDADRFRVALAGQSDAWAAGEAVRPTLAAHLALQPGLRSARLGAPSGSVGRMDRPVRIWLDGALLDSNLR